MTVSISRLEDLITTRMAGDMERLAAQHDAVPALLEVARAALAYMAAQDSDAPAIDYHRARSAANDVLRTALAKVSP